MHLLLALQIDHFAGFPGNMFSWIARNTPGNLAASLIAFIAGALSTTAAHKLGLTDKAKDWLLREVKLDVARTRADMAEAHTSLARAHESLLALHRHLGTDYEPPTTGDDPPS